MLLKRIFSYCSPIMQSCSRRPQAAKRSWSPASDAAAMCLQAGMNFRFNPSPSSAHSVANCVGTCPRNSSSDDLTNLWFTGNGPGAGDVRPGRPYAPNQSRDGVSRCVPHPLIKFNECPADTVLTLNSANGSTVTSTQESSTTEYSFPSVNIIVLATCRRFLPHTRP